MIPALPALSEFWADYYACPKHNIVKTINYMLDLHAPDFPNSCCVGFTITNEGSLYRIWPKVRYASFTYDHYTKERHEN